MLNRTLNSSNDTATTGFVVLEIEVAAQGKEDRATQGAVTAQDSLFAVWPLPEEQPRGAGCQVNRG
jgi:hypothetical protein